SRRRRRRRWPASVSPPSKTASRPSLGNARERRQKKFVGVARSLGPAGYSESESKTHTTARSRSGGEYTMTLAPGCSEAAACTTTGSAGAGVGAMTCHRVKAPMAAAASALPNATRGCLNPRRPCHDCRAGAARSEEHTSELQSRGHLVCRLLLEKKKHQR